MRTFKKKIPHNGMELIKQAPVIWNLLFLNKSCNWLPDTLLLGCDADAMLSKEAKDQTLSAKGKNYVIHMRSNPTFCAWEKRNGVSITQERSWVGLKEADKKAYLLPYIPVRKKGKKITPDPHFSHCKLHGKKGEFF